MKKASISMALLFVLVVSAVAQDPRQAASVTISFDGLVALFFGDASKVSAGVVNAHLHTPKITINRVSTTGSQLVAMISAAQMAGGLSFAVTGSPDAPMRYLPAEAWTDANDVRWAIDMNDLYGRRLAINKAALLSVLQFNSGLFYGEKISEFPVKFFSARGTGKTLPFKRKISQIASKINIPSGEKLIISGGQLAQSIELLSGYNYEIKVDNIPENYEDMTVAHFAHYYDLLDASNKIERYTPFFLMGVAMPPPTICAVVTFSQETP